MTLPVYSFWKSLICHTPGCTKKGSHIWFSHDRNIKSVACLECYCRLTNQRML